MEKIKKIGKIVLLCLGFVLMVGVWSYKISPAVTTLFTNAVTLIPDPQLDNPVPQCSECLESRGLSPRCINVCVQEVIFNSYATKPYLECFAVK